MATYYQKVNSEWKKMTLRGITGKNVKIAVLDTGNNNNPDFSVNFTTDGQLDVFGHGSLTGSIIKSSLGLAKDCILYNVKIITDSGLIMPNSFIQGLNYALANNVDVISMSFTIGNYDQLVQDKINECAAAGIVLMASSGNNTFLDQIKYPAGGLNVIAVNSIDNNGLVFYKNGIIGPLTHGIDICCSGLSSECLDKNGTVTNNNGTSLSTPWLAGAFALVKESLNYPSNKTVMNYILRRSIKQPDTQLYGQGNFTF